MSKEKHIKWNTGRSYTKEGQRMAAIVVAPDGVFVVDIDRGLSFYLADCPLEQRAIMSRYDSNDRQEYRPPQMPIDAYVALRKWLETYAL
jgi:hypothetical protein